MKPKRLIQIGFLALFTVLTQAVSQAQVVVNEFCIANYNDYALGAEFEDWIEFYNPTAAPINITGYWLSDNINNPQKFEIPAGTTVPANGYRLILVTGTFEFDPNYLGQINTSFKITQTAGEQIVFSNPAGVVLESYDFSSMSPNQANHSWGRQTDGAANMMIFTNPTPNSANVGASGTNYAATPVFSVQAGYYTGATNVSITTTEPNSSIRYTTDGSIPTAASTLYTGPVAINATTVLRAIVTSSDANILPSFVETNTYFIGTDQHSIVVASISGASLSDGSWFGNELTHLEIFDANGNFVVEATGDSNEHGNDSNAYAQRGFDYVTRDALGYDNEIEAPIINTRDRDGYERIIFKAAANDNYPFSNGGAHIRDAYVHQLSILGDLKVDERSTESCVLYINGDYWGVYEMREKVDDIDFTDHYFEQPEGFVDFLKTWGGTWTEYGDGTDWYDLVDFITTNDMTNQANYDYVVTQYNTNSLIDYFVLNSYTVCTDWLNWNTAWWRGRHPDGDARRWRYALWDSDNTFGHGANYTGVDSTNPDADPCQVDEMGDVGGQGHVPVLNALFDNEQFFADYIQRYAQLSNTIFSCDRMIEVLDSMINVIDPEMQRQCQRWGGTYAGWQNNVQEMRDFILARCSDEVIGGIEDCYDVTAYTLTVQIDGVGVIEVEDYNLDETTAPWSGTFFGDLPLDLDIPGLTCGTFVGWEIVSGTGTLVDPAAPQTQLTLQSDVTLVAHFVASTGVSSITYASLPAEGGVITVNGAAVANEETIDYPLGETQSASVTENEWFEFVEWQSPIEIEPNEEMMNITFTSCLSDTLFAVFEEIPHAELTIDVFPANAGAVEWELVLLPFYPTVVTVETGNYNLTAVEIPDVTTFSHWTINNNVISPDDLTMDIILNLQVDDTIVAVFNVLERVDLTIDVEPAGAGTITFDGNPLPSYSYTENLLTDVDYTFTTTPIDEWSTFDHWEINNHTLSPDALSTEVILNLQETDTLVAVYNVTPHYDVVLKVDPPYAGKAYFYDGTMTETEASMVLEGGIPRGFRTEANEFYVFKGWSWRTATPLVPETEFPLVIFEFNAPDTIIAHYEKEPLTYYVPNSFSPNNDGINDVFKPITNAVDPEYYHLMIFNRWGEMVFETKDSKQGWEGDYKGGEYYLKDDVYTYFLKVKWFHEEQYVEKDGTIMMFR